MFIFEFENDVIQYDYKTKNVDFAALAAFENDVI